MATRWQASTDEVVCNEEEETEAEAEAEDYQAPSRITWL